MREILPQAYDWYSEDKILSITQSLGEKIVLQMAPLAGSLKLSNQRRPGIVQLRSDTYSLALSFSNMFYILQGLRQHFSGSPQLQTLRRGKNNFPIADLCIRQRYCRGELSSDCPLCFLFRWFFPKIPELISYPGLSRSPVWIVVD